MRGDFNKVTWLSMSEQVDLINEKKNSSHGYGPAQQVALQV